MVREFPEFSRFSLIFFPKTSVFSRFSLSCMNPELTIQFSERSYVPGFLPNSQISHVNLIDSQNG